MKAAASISLPARADLVYRLRLADTALIHAQRLCEWCGHAPVLEEDIALANMALDLLGQARALLAHVAALDGRGFDEDHYAFLRDEQGYRNVTLAELPLRRGGGDFADTVLRNLLLAGWFKAMWQALLDSQDAELAAIAGKALKEARYHQGHAAEWVVRLGDGTEESAARMQAALQRAWPYVAELFEADEVDAAAVQSRLGPARSALQAGWLAELQPVLQEAGLPLPATPRFRSTGSRGLHSEHMGFLLAEMQHLQRAYPGGAW